MATMTLKFQVDDIENIKKILKKSRYLHDLEDIFLDALIKNGEVIELSAGRAFIKEGDADQVVYLLLQGDLEIQKGDKKLAAITSPGQVLGEMAIINQEPRYATVQATSQAFLLKLDPDKFSNHKNASLELAFAMMLNRCLAEKLKFTSDKAKLYEETLLESQQHENYSLELQQEITEKLREIKLYSETISNSKDAVFVTAPDGSGIFANHTFRALFLDAAHKIKEFNLIQLLPDVFEEKKSLPETIGSYWQGQREITSLNKSYPANVMASPVFFKDDLVGYSVVIQDITKQKAYESFILEKTEDLKRAQETLEETILDLENSQSAKDRFISSVSSEIKPPLYRINSIANQLLKEDQNHKRQLNSIINDENVIENMIEKLGQLANINHKRSLPQFSLIELNNIDDFISKQNIITIEKRKNKKQSRHIIADFKQVILALQQIIDSFDNKKSVRFFHYFNEDHQAEELVFSNAPPNAKSILNNEKLVQHVALAKQIALVHQGRMLWYDCEGGHRIVLELPLEPHKGLNKILSCVTLDDKSQRYVDLFEHASLKEAQNFDDLIELVSAEKPDIILISFTGAISSHLDLQKAVLQLKNVNPSQADIIILDWPNNSTSVIDDIKEASDIITETDSVELIRFSIKRAIWRKEQMNILSRSMEHVQERAVTDALTKVFNRRYYDDYVKEQLLKAKSENTPCSVILLDIDNFKHYNDSNGHLVGDEGLKITANVLMKNVRRSDMVARYGGEEFVVVLPNTSKNVALQVAEKLRRSLEKEIFPHEENQPLGKITASFGVSTFPENGDNEKSLLDAADACLYIAKEAGRNKVISADGNRPTRAAS